MKIGIFGGGFKPFTTGHFSKLSLALDENDLVILYYSLAERAKGSGFKFTKSMSKDIFDIVKPALDRTYGKKIQVILGTPSPVVRIFRAIEDMAHGMTHELSELGLDPDSIDKLTIYSDPDDLRRYTMYIDSPKEAKYFGTLLKSKRLVFDDGLSDDETDNISRMVASMRRAYPNLGTDELSDLIRIRGSDVRAIISSRDHKRIENYLPNFLNADEKSSVVAILIKNLTVSEGSDVLRSYIQMMVKDKA